MQHFSSFFYLQNLLKNKDIAVLKSDKGNSFLAVGKTSYLDKIEYLLNDLRNFKKLK